MKIKQESDWDRDDLWVLTVFVSSKKTSTKMFLDLQQTPEISYIIVNICVVGRTVVSQIHMSKS